MSFYDCTIVRSIELIILDALLNVIMLHMKISFRLPLYAATLTFRSILKLLASIIEIFFTVTSNVLYTRKTGESKREFESIELNYFAKC